MKENQKKASLFIANWKMNMPFASAREFLDKHQKALEHTAREHDTQVVLCPSFLALDYFCTKTKNSNVAKNSWLQIGAQDCSAYKSGAYTGQVDASSLAFMGCSYGIVGHSERRQYYGETDEMVAEKAARLMENGITPILCIGETEQEFASKKTKEVLMRQLGPVIAQLTESQAQAPSSGAQQSNREQSPHAKIIIAYEPVYAIGAGTAPDISHLTEIFAWLQDTIHKNAAGAFGENKIASGERTGQDTPYRADIRLIYGGSVTEDSASALLAIPHVSGLLIGTASLDFQKFQNIVSSSSRLLGL